MQYMSVFHNVYVCTLMIFEIELINLQSCVVGPNGAALVVT